ncbi:13580_t:CDS:2 [Funneliformis caledonium]|uniref:13580_t:CDS:1 n=1 Tax=Funneliformis caledonium TaxID=1117310 RepID=A0A9N9ACA2_9GLOM|nr:13580_t:CDS:2 [Funneliformis caledonium]
MPSLKITTTRKRHKEMNGDKNEIKQLVGHIFVDFMEWVTIPEYSWILNDWKRAMGCEMRISVIGIGGTK